MKISKVHTFDCIHSTNDEANRLALEGAPEGEVVIADSQTAGRGRFDRHWESPAGKSIYLSLILRPDISPVQSTQLTLVAAVAIAETLANFSKVKPFIKWPNDVLINEKKVCGILTEMSVDREKINFVVVGIGINVNTDHEDFSEEIKDTATSLAMVNGSECDRNEITQAFFRKFEEWYRKYLSQGFSPVRKRYSELSCLHGKRIEVVFEEERQKGVCEGIDETGALLIKTDNGNVKRILAGDVIILK
jgi:BirA family biotin operon repressor/biotin-[acetyl-CoA-carboxylase] ligase